MVRNVDLILRQWARWVSRKNDSGVGWPTCAAGFSDCVSSGVYGSRELWAPSDADMRQVDRAVNALDQELRQAVLAYYCTAGTFRRAALMLNAALRLNLDHKTVQRRVVKAQMAIGTALGLRLAAIGGGAV